jgi:hypothetical protein
MHAWLAGDRSPLPLLLPYQPRALLGRDPFLCDVLVGAEEGEEGCPDVGRVHAAVIRGHFGSHAEALFLADLGSAHGTFVDGAPLAKCAPHRLQDGQRVAFGASRGVRYTFRCVPNHLPRPLFPSTAPSAGSPGLGPPASPEALTEPPTDRPKGPASPPLGPLLDVVLETQYEAPEPPGPRWNPASLPAHRLSCRTTDSSRVSVAESTQLLDDDDDDDGAPPADEAAVVLQTQPQDPFGWRGGPEAEDTLPPGPDSPPAPHRPPDGCGPGHSLVHETVDDLDELDDTDPPDALPPAAKLRRII